MSAIGLPVTLLAHFVPRPPIQFEPPPQDRKLRHLDGMAQYVDLFENETPPPREVFETPRERRNRRKQERQIQHELRLAEARAEYNPSENPVAVSDPYKTLFVGRLAYETTDRTLRRVFEEWGRVKDIKIINDKDGKSRGYAFVEYEHERDLKDAYKHADGIKIDGRNVLVDVERGRTVPGWFPRRLGGGKGPGRVGFHPRQKKMRQQMARPSHDRYHPGFKRPRSPPRGPHRDDRYQHDNRDSSRKYNY